MDVVTALYLAAGIALVGLSVLAFVTLRAVNALIREFQGDLDGWFCPCL